MSFAIRSYTQICEGHAHPSRRPDVVASNNEVALLNAVRVVFSITQRITRRWHGNVNIVEKGRKNFLSDPRH